MESNKTFEESLRKLEEITHSLENGDLGLDKAIEKFEEGIALSKNCSKKLQDAEKKINILLKDELGVVTEEKFAE